MRFIKQPRRNLPEIVDEADRRVALQRILNAENVDLSFVKKRMKEVVDVQRRVAALLRVVNFSLSWAELDR